MTHAKDPLVEALAGRYVIERELGQGGMASVYQARAEGRAEPVAIKVMNPNVADALDNKRFIREMGVAASLEHPLIVPLIDSGRGGGVLYYVMPLVAGESLYERLQRERRLPVSQALGIARDVATALAYAHDRGVLHRDVKPENILLAGGRALIADFGLARAIGAADYTKLTATGVIVGTALLHEPGATAGRARPRPADGRLQPGMHAVRDAVGGAAVYRPHPHRGGEPDPARAHSLRSPTAARGPRAGGRGHRTGARQGSRRSLYDHVGAARCPPGVLSQNRIRSNSRPKSVRPRRASSLGSTLRNTIWWSRWAWPRCSHSIAASSCPSARWMSATSYCEM